MKCEFPVTSGTHFEGINFLDRFSQNYNIEVVQQGDLDLIILGTENTSLIWIDKKNLFNPHKYWACLK